MGYTFKGYKAKNSHMSISWVSFSPFSPFPLLSSLRRGELIKRQRERERIRVM